MGARGAKRGGLRRRAEWPAWLRGAFFGSLLLTGLWLLAPQRGLRRAGGAVEITYTGPSGPIQGALEDAVREFERLSRERHSADPSYPVYRVVSGQNASRSQTEDPTRFLVSVAGGMPPDVILFDRYAISEWAARNAFTPLDDLVEADRAAWRAWQERGGAAASGLPPWPGAAEAPPRSSGALPMPPVEPIDRAKFYPACWDEAVYRDPLTGREALYAIPSVTDDRALLYNKDLLVRHGYTNELGEARPPRTWEELEEMAVAMTERDEEGRIRTIGFIPNYGNVWLYMYGWQAGGEFMSADGRTCTLNDPSIVYALEYMTRMYRRLGGTKEVYAFQTGFQGGELDPFILGKVAMKVDGVWQMGNLAVYGPDLNFGVAPAPMPRRELEKGRVPVTWEGGWAWAIPSSAKEKRGAWELIRFLASRRAHRIMLRAQYYAALSQGRPFVPGQSAQRDQTAYAYREYVLANPSLEERFKEGMSTFNELLETARYRPVTPVGQKLWNAHVWAMEDAIFGKKSPREALDHYTAMVQRDLDEILDPPPGRPIRGWRWFLWLYGVLVLAAGWIIFLWDTRVGPRVFRARRRRARGPGAPSAAGGPGGLEGLRGGYFRTQWRDGFWFAFPWIFGFVVFTGGPLLFSIVISFCRFDVLNDAVLTGLDNYRTMLHGDELFWKALYNTLFMVIGIPLGMALSFALALLLNVKVRGVAVWRTMFYLPSIVPAVASSILWIWILNPSGGLLNGALRAIGIDGPQWLQDEHTSKWALILMGLWGAGGGMIIWLAGLKGISRSYYESAAIDGANAWQRFRFVTVPLMTPYIFFNLVMGLIGTFQIFTQAFIMTAGGPVNSTLFYAYHLFNNAFRYLRMGYAAAMAWFLFVIVVSLTIVQMRLSSRWVHYEEG